MKFKHKIITIILIFFLGALITTSGLIEVNINHWAHLPKLDRDGLTITKSCTLFSLNCKTIVDVRMDETLGNVDTVKSLIRAMQEADKNTIIIFHLYGYGGNADTMFLIINNMIATRGKTVAIVEAPIYSAYALIAISAQEFYVAPYSYLMFHTSSAFDLNCSDRVGTDRAMTKEQSCYLFKNHHMAIINKLIMNSKLLTDDEKMSLIHGYEVYITHEQAKERSGY